MRSIDQKIDHLKNQILDGLTQKGILNELQSRFLSNVAQFIQTTDYDVFKPHRERRQTPEYEIAEIVVAQYLKTKNMMHTLQSITYEFKIDEKEIDPDSEKSSEITNKINIEKNGLWIHQIINDWIKNKEVLIKQNKEYDRQIVKNRLNQIDNKSNIENNDQIDDNSNNNFSQPQQILNNNDNDNSNDNSGIKNTYSNQNPDQSKSNANEDLIPSLNKESTINLDPDWVINDDETKKVSTDIQEEEEHFDDSDSQNDKPGKPIWIIESPTAKDTNGSSGEFVSDDDEPPSIFTKQETLNKANTPSDNSKDISVNANGESNLNENANNNQSNTNNNLTEKEDKKSDNITVNIDDKDAKSNDDGDIEDFINANLNDIENNQIDQNTNSSNNDKITNNNINEQNSFDFDVDIDFLDDGKENSQNKDNAKDIFDDKEEEDIFENQIETVKDKKEKLLSDDFDEPEKTQKKEVSTDNFDDFEEFNDDSDHEAAESLPNEKQNIVNQKPPTDESKKQKSIISSESDIDFENLDSDPPTINSKPKTNSNSTNKSKNQGSDSSLDFSSGSFDENDKPKANTQPSKQTKKIGSNSSIDFDIDFSDDSPTKTAKSSKKEQKNSNDANENNQSDFDDFDDTSM